MSLKKSIFIILLLLLSFYTVYDYGYTKGYNEGYFEGSIEGYITNKYITHDYANFSAEGALNEKNKLMSIRGMNMSESSKIFSEKGD